MGRELRWALENGQFNVYFQPCYDVASQRVTSAEALLRWFHPLRGLVPPGEIIPVAQMNNLAHALGEWVMDNAWREAAAEAPLLHELHPAARDVVDPPDERADIRCASLGGEQSLQIETDGAAPLSVEHQCDQFGNGFRPPGPALRPDESFKR